MNLLGWWHAGPGVVLAGGTVTALALIGLAWQVRGWARTTADRRLIAGAVLAVSLLSIACPLVLADDVPLLIAHAPLQEGRTEQTLQLALGGGERAGPYLGLVQQTAAGNRRATLASKLRTNVWLTGVSVILLFVIARVVLCDYWLALLAAGLFLFNGATMSATAAAGPAPLLAVLTLLATLCVGCANRVGQGRMAATVATVVLALLAGLIGAVRSELLIVAAPAVVALLVRSRWPRAFDRAAAGCRSAGTWVVRRHPVVLIVAAAVLVVPVQWLQVHHPADLFADALNGLHPYWLLDVVSPLNLDVLQPLVVGLRLLPVGVVLLGAIGIVDGIAQGRRFVLAPLMLLLLARLYGVAGHGHPWEMVRYSLNTWPLFAVCAVHGWPAIARWSERIWPNRPWRRPAGIVVVGLCLVPVFGPLYPRMANTLRQQTVRRDAQQESALLVEMLQTHPQCRIHAPLLRQDTTERSWGVVGGGVPGVMLDKSLPKLRARSSRFATSRCELLFIGLDCHLVNSPGCAVHALGKRRLLREMFLSAPFVAHHIGVHRRVIDIRVHQLAGPPLPAAPWHDKPLEY